MQRVVVVIVVCVCVYVEEMMWLEFKEITFFTLDISERWP